MNSKVTFLVGHNNSGKTGILRFLGLLLNDSQIREIDLPTSGSATGQPMAEILLSKDTLQETNLPLEKLKQDIPNTYKIVCKLGQQRTANTPQEIISAFEDGALDENWGEFQGGTFIARNQLVQNFGDAMLSKLPRTIYVPGQRIILQDKKFSPHFGQVDFPGASIEQNTVVGRLAGLTNPHGNQFEQREAKDRYSKLCGFIAECIEAHSVQIRVPPQNQTVYVTIDGEERPISNLGSGIEQLLLIGLGSFSFPDHLVLIDEPEIHFHPRTQKRMMKYLRNNADAKFVIATHSAAILDSIEADIVEVRQENHQCFGRTIQNNSDRYEAVRNLGHSPSELVLANFVIWVEGPSDRIYINHWIERLDPKLIEGTDYAIIFYGGSILARHGFEDDDEDLVKALSVSRNFAVYIDSDKSAETTALKPRVERVAKEVAANAGMCWISEGREIENYLPPTILSQMNGFKLNPYEKFGKVVDGDFDKVKFAEQTCKFWKDEWPLDLKTRCDELVNRIRVAR